MCQEFVERDEISHYRSRKITMPRHFQTPCGGHITVSIKCRPRRPLKLDHIPHVLQAMSNFRQTQTCTLKMALVEPQYLKF